LLAGPFADKRIQARLRRRAIAEMAGTRMLDIYVDADACPVRFEVFRVAERHGLTVHVVTCGTVRVPRDPRIRLALVAEGPDAADDWIAERIGPRDICVTADVPLAARCLKRGASALGPTGRRFTPDKIGPALAARDLATHLREIGAGGKGPDPLGPRDRSRFLGELDAIINAIRRAG
jgi:uncharacterized protein YaiI (UPF0178 family)